MRARAIGRINLVGASRQKDWTPAPKNNVRVSCRNSVLALPSLFLQPHFRPQPMPRPRKRAAQPKAERLTPAVALRRPAASRAAAAVRALAPDRRYPARPLGRAPAATSSARQPATPVIDLRPPSTPVIDLRPPATPVIDLR